MTNNHAGNIRFRQLINVHKLRYLEATKVQKPNVAREVVEIWRAQSPPGRFLTMSNDSNANTSQTIIWHDVGDNKARMKASQCLRERTPDVIPIVQYVEDSKKIESSITKIAPKTEKWHNMINEKVPMKTSQYLRKRKIDSDLIVQSLQDTKKLHEMQTYFARANDISKLLSKSNSLRIYADKTNEELRFRQFQVMKRLHVLQEQQRLLALQTHAAPSSLPSNVNISELNNENRFDLNLKGSNFMERSILSSQDVERAS